MLRRERERLTLRLDDIAGPGDVYQFQKDLADEIIRAEAVAFGDRLSPEAVHIHRLKLLGDGLAWLCLHPSAVRQLAGDLSVQPALSPQGDGFVDTMNAAREQCERGIPALVPELTHSLGVGGVVTCADPQRPLVIEGGGQEAHVPDDPPTPTPEGGASMEYSWEFVTQCVGQALATGEGVAVPGRGDIVFARSACRELSVPKAAQEPLRAFRTPLVGAHVTKLEVPDPNVPPSVVWPIPPTMRMALIEYDIDLVHVIDLDVFCETGRDDVKISVPAGGETIDFLRAEIDGLELQMSGRFIGDVLYGFQTIESASACVLKGLDGIRRAFGKGMAP